MSNTLLSTHLGSISLSKGFDKDYLRSSGSSGSGPSRFELLAEYAGVLSAVDNVSPEAQSTRFLAPVGSGTTISAGGSRAPQTFTIEYANITRSLKRALLRNVVENQFSSAATRIMSILMTMGKLEEKHVRSHTAASRVL